jgi:hypothetical protein
MSNPKELTLGELRLALARGSNEQTVREALEAIREDDAVAARHEQATAAYRAYVEERRRRLQAAEEEPWTRLTASSSAPAAPGTDGKPATRLAGRLASRRGNASSSTSRCSSSRTGSRPVPLSATRRRPPPPAGRPASTLTQQREAGWSRSPTCRCCGAAATARRATGSLRSRSSRHARDFREAR